MSRPRLDRAASETWTRLSLGRRSAAQAAFRSLRARLLALLLGGVIVPLGVLAWWTTQRRVRSGRALLQSQLDSALAQSVAEFDSHWKARRADLLLLVENEPTRRMLRDSTPIAASSPDPFVTRAFAQMSDIDHIVLVDARGSFDGRSARPTRRRIAVVGYLREPFVVTRLPRLGRQTGETIGRSRRGCERHRCSPESPPPHRTTVLSPRSEPRTATSSRRPAADDGVFLRGVDRAGRRWLVVRRAIALPALEISIAGALDPVLAPFERTANAALAALAVAAGVVTCILLIAARRMTAGLEDAVVAAEAVAGETSIGACRFGRRTKSGDSRLRSTR